MTLKSLLGWLIILFCGFVVFIICSGLGYAMAITFAVMSWWQIAAGTLLGTVMWVLHLFKNQEKRKCLNGCR